MAEPAPDKTSSIRRLDAPATVKIDKRRRLLRNTEPQRDQRIQNRPPHPRMRHAPTTVDPGRARPHRMQLDTQPLADRPIRQHVNAYLVLKAAREVPQHPHHPLRIAKPPERGRSDPKLLKRRRDRTQTKADHLAAGKKTDRRKTERAARSRPEQARKPMALTHRQSGPCEAENAQGHARRLEQAAPRRHRKQGRQPPAVRQVVLEKKTRQERRLSPQVPAARPCVTFGDQRARHSQRLGQRTPRTDRESEVHNGTRRSQAYLEPDVVVRDAHGQIRHELKKLFPSGLTNQGTGDHPAKRANNLSEGHRPLGPGIKQRDSVTVAAAVATLPTIGVGVFRSVRVFTQRDPAVRVQAATLHGHRFQGSRPIRLAINGNRIAIA